MIFPIADYNRFHLDQDFVSDFRGQNPLWGPLGQVTFARTYARDLNYGQLETFSETLERVVNGTFSVLQQHLFLRGKKLDQKRAQNKAREMFRRMWEFKFLPGGRGLWAMGTPQIEKYGCLSLNNCAFVSTKHITPETFYEPFCTLMDFLMCGAGVGFDTRGKHKIILRNPDISEYVHVIEDSKSGWLSALRLMLDAFALGESLPEMFDYSLIRLAGSKISSGGTAAGPQALKTLLDDTLTLCKRYIDQPIDSAFIVDLSNYIGRCVVAGNVRRSAEIALGDHDDVRFLDLKNRALYPTELMSHRWASNNSVFCTDNMDYEPIVQRTITNGEPNYYWQKHCQKWGRLIDPPTWEDDLIDGVNPCQPKWAKLLTPTGIKTMGDVVVGDTIWSGKRWTKIVNKVFTGVKPVHAYKTTAGTFYGTEHHRVVCNGIKVEARIAKAIDACVGPAVEQASFQLTDVIDGLVLGDGSFHKASNRVFLVIGEDDFSYHTSDIKPFIGEYRPGVHENYWEINTSFKNLPLTFDREIPDRFMHGSFVRMCSFLRGLYSANGCVTGGRVALKAASYKVISQVQVMLSSLGMQSFVTTNAAKKVLFANGEYVCKESYDLNIGTIEGRQIFQRLIGFIQPYKNIKLSELCRESDSPFACYKNKKTFEVRSCTYISTEEVFDITVDDQEHTYWTDGLLVSNCGEIPLEHLELCNVVETFPGNHSDICDFRRTCKFAFLYGKIVSLIPAHNEKTNAIIQRNRRVGISLAGVIDWYETKGRRSCVRWMDEGYATIRAMDREYSDWLEVPRSKKTTTVKPGGTVPLLVGLEGGMRATQDHYYYRTIRMKKEGSIVKACKKAGYLVEDDLASVDTSVVYFPIRANPITRVASQLSLWEQAKIFDDLQTFWSDNSVSATLMFQSHERSQVKNVLESYGDRWKVACFLPLENDAHRYDQAPYQAITEDDYLASIVGLKPLNLQGGEHEEDNKYCDGDTCKVT